MFYTNNLHRFSNTNEKLIELVLDFCSVRFNGTVTYFESFKLFFILLINICLAEYFNKVPMVFENP